MFSVQFNLHLSDVKGHVAKPGKWRCILIGSKRRNINPSFIFLFSDSKILMDKKSDNSSEPAPIISHEEIHANVPSISQNISDQDYAYYHKKNTNQPYVDTSSANVVMKDKKQKPKKPRDFVIFSCFVILGANFIFGFLGYYFGRK